MRFCFPAFAPFAIGGPAPGRKMWRFLRGSIRLGRPHLGSPASAGMAPPPSPAQGSQRDVVSIGVRERRRFSHAIHTLSSQPPDRDTSTEASALWSGFRPIIPGLTDHEIEPILEAARDAGACWADYVTLRLPLEVSPLFQEWLAASEPLKASKVMKAVRETQGGRDYDPEWGRRQRGAGVLADLIARRFDAARRRFGLTPKEEVLRTDLFRRPVGCTAQLDLGL